MKLIEAIQNHEFWTSSLDKEDVMNIVASAQIASTGQLVIWRNGISQYYSGHIRIPLEAAIIETKYNSMSTKEALSKILNAIEEANNTIIEQISIAAFDDGRHGRKPLLVDNPYYLKEWNRGQDHAPWRCKFEDARAKDKTQLKFLTTDDEVAIDKNYVVGEDRHWVKVQQGHSRGGWTCLHLTGPNQGNQRRHQCVELAEIMSNEYPSLNNTTDIKPQLSSWLSSATGYETKGK